MISILLVEDDPEKARLISEAIFEVEGVSPEVVHHASSVIEAKQALQRKRYDLLLLDINLPPRIDKPVKVGGGLDILRALRTGGRGLHTPTYVIGLTAHRSGFLEAAEEFSNPLWKLVPFAHDDNSWRDPLKGAVLFVSEANHPPYRNDGATFHCTLGVVVGLEDVELESVRALDPSFKQLRVPHDPTRYFKGQIQDSRGCVDVVVAAAPKMGLTSAAVVATRLIETFRPKYLGIPGICAGVRSETGLGDILVADPCWDWGGGKITTRLESERFLGAPYQWRLDAGLRSAAKDISEDSSWLENVYLGWAHGRPANKPKVLIDAVASGASVLQRKAAMDAIKEQHKNLVGVEMEIYGVLTSASYAPAPRPIAFGAKSVCDFGEEDKGGEVQRYAAYLSAEFLRELALRTMAGPLDVSE